MGTEKSLEPESVGAHAAEGDRFGEGGQWVLGGAVTKRSLDAAGEIPYSGGGPVLRVYPVESGSGRLISGLRILFI